MSLESDAQVRRENMSFINEMEAKLCDKVRERSGGEVRIIVSGKDGRSLVELMTGQRALTHDERSEIQFAVKRRMRGEPLEYILGKSYFMDIELNMPHGVFIPRSETAVLVEEGVECGQLLDPEKLEILDLGTGSGNIILALCMRLPGSKGRGIDVSLEAVEAAEKNVSLHGMGSSITISRLDYQSRDFACAPKRYDMIVVNPPYVGRKEYPHLQMEVRHEPTQALIGGDAGFELPRWILRRIRSKIKPGGFLLMEIGKGQDKILAEEVNKNSEWDLVKIANDENDIPRVLVIRVKGKE